MRSEEKLCGQREEKRKRREEEGRKMRGEERQVGRGERKGTWLEINRDYFPPDSRSLSIQPPLPSSFAPLCERAAFIQGQNTEKTEEER